VQGDPDQPLDVGKVPPSALPLKQLGLVRDASKNAVGIDAQKQKKYEELQRTIGQMESALRKLETEHLHAKGAGDRRKELQQRRRDEYIEVFNTYVDEETTLDELYAPLSKSLSASKGTLSKLAFVVEREVKIDEWVKLGEDLLDLRRESRFRGRGALLAETEKYLLGPWCKGGPAEVAEAMDKFRSDFQEDFKKAIPEFENPQDLRTRRMEVSTWLYSTDHIKVQYGITYEGTVAPRSSS
jgi:type II secretory pathway component PulJ